MSLEVAHLRIPGGVADGNTERVVHSTPIALDADNPTAMLIHKVGVSMDARAAAAGSAFARQTVELGLSTEEDGNPMVVMAGGNRNLVWDAGSANDGAHGVADEFDVYNLIEGTMWVAPYWVLLIANENMSGLANARVQIQYDIIELEDFRTQLALWNRVDEVQDRERATTVFP